MSIHANNYTTYDGPISLTTQPWRIAKQNLRTYLSFTRTYLVGLALLIPSPIITFALVFIEQIIFDNTNTNPETSYFVPFLTYHFVATVILFAVSTPGVIADDAAHRTFQFYFSKPISFVDYLAGKLLSLFLLGSFVSVIPTAFILTLRVLLFAKQPFFLEILGYSAITFGLSVFLTLILSLFMLAISSLTRHKGLVTLFWLGSFVVPYMASILMSATTDTESIANFFNPLSLVKMLANWLFQPGQHSKELPWIALIIIVAIGAASLAGAWKKLHNLTRGGI